MTMRNIFCLAVTAFLTSGFSYAQTNTFPSTGNAGIGTGTTLPSAKLSFNDLNDGTNGADGIAWYNPSPLDYGIYRTSGAWNSPNYQQLKVNFLTGIVLNPGSAYGKSFVEIQGGGLRVSSGHVGIGTTSPFFRMHIRGSNPNSDLMSLGTSTTGNFALTSADGGAYGLFGGISSTGRAWLQAGRYDTNVSYDLSVQASGGDFGVGTSDPRFKLDVAGEIATGVTFLQNALDAENNYTRSNFGSNVYWDAIANRWQISPNGNNDFSSMIHPNGDGLGFITAPATGNVPRTLTDGEFMAYERMRINASGNVLIGKRYQSNSAYKLDVNGSLRANEVIVNVTGADFVFAQKYRLRTLEEVEKYINENNHLPDIESAKQMKANGLPLGAMDMALLRKIEELTLYMIGLKKELELLKEENQELKKTITYRTD